MTALAVFSICLAAGTYAAIAYSERSRDIDNHIRRFLDQIDRERK